MSHKRGKVLNSDARKIVYNVIKYFQNEKDQRAYHPYENAHARSQMATGLGKNTITKIKKEGQRAEQLGVQIKTPSKGKRGSQNTRVPVDNFMRTAIRDIIASIYDVGKEVPTLKKILASARQNLDFKGCRNTLRKILINDLGFKFKKCRHNRKVLLERSNIIAWRVKYLRKLRANDNLGAEKRPVIYLDETWVHSNYTVSKILQSDTDKRARKNDSAGQRWIVVHAGSEQGFVQGADFVFKANNKNGDHHDQMNGEQFTKYVKEKLIPNLPLNSIVVMDNASNHSMEVNKIPSSATRKDAIQEWLHEHGITFEEYATKAELLQLVKRNKPEKTYVIDALFADYGHEVLRLPPYNSDLNAIEYIFNLVKQRVADKNVEQHNSKIEKLTKDAIASITPCDWEKVISHVKRLEQEYWDRDVGREQALEDFIISVGVESGTEESSDDDEDDFETSEEEVMSGIEELQVDKEAGPSNVSYSPNQITLYYN